MKSQRRNLTTGLLLKLNNFLCYNPPSIHLGLALPAGIRYFFRVADESSYINKVYDYEDSIRARAPVYSSFNMQHESYVCNI